RLNSGGRPPTPNGLGISHRTDKFHVDDSRSTFGVFRRCLSSCHRTFDSFRCDLVIEFCPPGCDCALLRGLLSAEAEIFTAVDRALYLGCSLKLSLRGIAPGCAHCGPLFGISSCRLCRTFASKPRLT